MRLETEERESGVAFVQDLRDTAECGANDFDDDQLGGSGVAVLHFAYACAAHRLCN